MDKQLSKHLSVKIGSDPEMMLTCAKTGQLRSAIPIIPEGKGRGRPLNKKGTNAVLHDNVLVEFNTTPAASENQFVKTIGSVLGKISKLVEPSGMKLLLRASADFPESELQNQEARIFGCEPDFDAWTLVRNEVPPGASERPFRSAGGHLHIGMNRDPKLNAILADDLGKIAVVKALDIFCGIPSVFLDKDPTAAARRALYGGAGAHRPKDYGVEYRALGNWWLATPDHTRLVHKLTIAGLRVVCNEQLQALIEKIGQERVISTINESDILLARELYNEYVRPFLDSRTHKLCKKLDERLSKDFHRAWKIK